MFGSSYKTSDFIVDILKRGGMRWRLQRKAVAELLQIKMDNGSESKGYAPSFCIAEVQFADHIANRSRWGTTRPITASTIRLSGAGVS